MAARSMPRTVEESSPSTCSRPSPAAPVIVGYDGTPESSDALALGLDLAAVFEAPLVVVSVLPPRRWRSIHAYDADLAEQGERLDTMARRQGGDRADRDRGGPGAEPCSASSIESPESERPAWSSSAPRTADPSGGAVPGTVADRLLATGASPVAIAPRDSPAPTLNSTRRQSASMAQRNRGWHSRRPFSARPIDQRLGRPDHRC